MRIFLLLLFCCSGFSVFGQKMLLLERANRARTTKFYLGAELKFRLVGEENYWYQRTITDILPETNTLMLDNFAVKLTEIQTLKMRRKPHLAYCGRRGLFARCNACFSHYHWAIWIPRQGIESSKTLRYCCRIFCHRVVFEHTTKIEIGGKTPPSYCRSAV